MPHHLHHPFSEATLAKTCAPRGGGMLRSSSLFRPTVRQSLAAPGRHDAGRIGWQLGAAGTTPEATLPAVTVKEQAAPQGKEHPC